MKKESSKEPQKEQKKAKADIKAEACGTCGQEPAVTEKDGGGFEVKCNNCTPFRRGNNKNGQLISYRADGETANEAVENWNAGNWAKK